MSEAQTFSWRQARELLQESGHGVNEAQAILEDLAHWGPTSAFSVKTGDRRDVASLRGASAGRCRPGVGAAPEEAGSIAVYT